MNYFMTVDDFQFSRFTEYNRQQKKSTLCKSDILDTRALVRKNKCIELRGVRSDDGSIKFKGRDPVVVPQLSLFEGFLM